MSTMAASEAAPLPRLGEVFFDVRGSSRSMRLSWYADTGVSVFSIWQGGTCTGTFRLPLEELPRLIDALQRGMPPGTDQPRQVLTRLDAGVVDRGAGVADQQGARVPVDQRLRRHVGGLGEETLG